MAVFPGRSEGPVLHWNGPEDRVEAGVAAASPGPSALCSVLRGAALRDLPAHRLQEEVRRKPPYY